jgi:hypothetical protein
MSNARIVTPAQSYAYKMTFSPNLDRAGLREQDAIVAQMADDLRMFAANSGSVSEDDLELLGWTPAQIATYGRDATRRAYALSGVKPPSR